MVYRDNTFGLICGHTLQTIALNYPPWWKLCFHYLRPHFFSDGSTPVLIKRSTELYIQNVPMRTFNKTINRIGHIKKSFKQSKANFPQNVAHVHFYTPVWKTDVLCYGNVRPSVCPSVRPSVRPSFPDFFSTCFEISIWNLVYAFSRWHDMSSLSFITIGSLWPSLQPKVGQTQFLQSWPYKSR